MGFGATIYVLGDLRPMQFDVYENPSPRMRDEYPFVVDIQSDLLSGLPSRMVVPLALSDLSLTELPHRLCPIFNVKSRRVILLPYEAAPLDKRLLKKAITSLRDQAHEVISALDAVTSGV
jgi:toxin CcdB